MKNNGAKRCRQLFQTLVYTGMVLIGATVPSTMASASSADPVLPPAGYQEWTYSKEQFGLARNASRQRAARESRSGVADPGAAERENAVQEFVQQEKSRGNNIPTSAVEFIDIDWDIKMVAPKTLQVEQIKLTQLIEHRGEGAAKEARSKVGVEVITRDPVLSLAPAQPSGTAAAAAAPDWDQGSPAFTTNYNIRITGQGTFYTGVEKYKLQNDGSTTKDYFTYYRWGSGQPENSLHYVSEMKLRNYPDAATKPKIQYHRFGPLRGETNYCGNINAGLSLIAEFTATFPLECNNITPQVNGMGDFQLNWHVAGTQISSTPRGLEMTNGIQVPNGFNPNTINAATLVMENYWGQSWTCSATNTGRTCVP